MLVAQVRMFQEFVLDQQSKPVKLGSQRKNLVI